MSRIVGLAGLLLVVPFASQVRGQVFVEEVASIHAAATAAWRQLSPSPDTGTFYYRVAQADGWRHASRPGRIFDSTAIRRLGLDPQVTMVELPYTLTPANRSVIEDSVLARTGIRLVHLADADYQRLTEKTPGSDFWTRFRERFQDAVGLLTYSTTRLNTDAGVAALVVDFGCGFLCGNGGAFLMRRTGTGWEDVLAGRLHWVR